MRKRVFAFLLLGLFVCVSGVAKEKEYQDGNLITFAKGGPNLAQAIQATAYGIALPKVWVFEVKVGDLTYGAALEHGKVKEGAFQPDSTIKIRFEKKGGAIATRTWMYILTPENKELELQVLSIRDANNNQYCGKRKCDPDSAEKKAHGE